MSESQPPATSLSRWQLAASSALSPFALVVVSPMLPELRRMYDATEVDVQFVISAYLFGLCIAQLILGALSDRHGRRAVLLASLAVYVAMSVICAVAPSLETLIIARFLQGCGAAGTAAICRASVHDVTKADTAAYYMSYIAAANSIAHTLAPAVGGYAGDAFGFSGVLVALAGLGLVMLVWSWRSMAETKKPNASSRSLGLWHLLAVNAHLFKSPQFVCYAMIYGLTGAPFFAFLAVAPAYFADTFGVVGGAFGINWSFMSIAFLTGAMTSARLVKRLGRNVLLGRMIYAAVGIGVGWPILVAVGGGTLFTLIAPLVLLSLVLGLITPITLSGAIGAHAQLAGAASGLSGALAMASAAILSIVAGALYDGTALGLTWPLTASMVMMAGFYLALRITQRRAHT